MGIESLSALLSDGLVAAGVNEMLRSLLVDGIVAGVGGILTFLPNIFYPVPGIGIPGGQRIHGPCRLCHGGYYE